MGIPVTSEMKIPGLGIDSSDLVEMVIMPVPEREPEKLSDKVMALIEYGFKIKRHEGGFDVYVLSSEEKRWFTSQTNESLVYFNPVKDSVLTVSDLSGDKFLGLRKRLANGSYKQ